MFNLILTQVCNRRCQYCFAREMLTEGADAGQNHMEPSMFEAGRRRSGSWAANPPCTLNSSGSPNRCSVGASSCWSSAMV